MTRTPDESDLHFVGAVYGLGLTLWGMIMSGGGHFNLLLMLFISPFGVGLLFWPLWAYLTAGAMSRVMRAVFLSTATMHYFGLIYYVFGTDNSDLILVQGGKSGANVWVPGDIVGGTGCGGPNLSVATIRERRQCKTLTPTQKALRTKSNKLQPTAEKRGPQLSGQPLGIVTLTSSRDQVDVLSLAFIGNPRRAN